MEVLAVEEEAGLDTAVDFVLRGPATDLDRALAAAEFHTELQPGVQIYQPPLPVFDLAKLTSPQAGEDRWKNPSGQSVVRVVVRGGTAEGQEILHVWAFTT